MYKISKPLSLIWIYTIVLIVLYLTAVIGSKTVTVFTESAPVAQTSCVVIDAGHGGVDGGATSCTGILESSINLEIALRLDDLMHLLGIRTEMIRRTDISVYTKGESIAAKKVSDLKNRVKIVNEIPNAILISIHQNHFSDSRYSGAQVFYADNIESMDLAKDIQTSMITNLNHYSKRQVKKATGIYIMQNITCPGVLIECGFISNPTEESQLRGPGYQKKLCCVIGASLSRYLREHTAA